MSIRTTYLATCDYPDCITYDDWDDSSEDSHPQVGDYGVAVRETYDGQEEIPFHIEREEHTGLPVALLNVGLYAKPDGSGIMSASWPDNSTPIAIMCSRVKLAVPFEEPEETETTKQSEDTK